MTNLETAALIAKIRQLKHARQALGWSEETCAHYLGVTYSTLNRWERGETLPRSQAILHVIDEFLAKYGSQHRQGGE